MPATFTKPEALSGRFAIVHPWHEPKPAAQEAIARIKIAARAMGLDCIDLDPDGIRLEAPFKRVCPRDIDFVLHLDCTTPKAFAAFSFLALWEPLPRLGDNDVAPINNNLLTHDDYLSGLPAEEVHSISALLSSDPTRAPIQFSLLNSLAEPILEPTLGKGKIFHAGMNWERVDPTKKGPHHELLKMLDLAGELRIHGPKMLNGVHLWKNWRCYNGPLPADGVGTVRAINEAGISLILSPGSTQESDLAFSRLFESLAAGAVIICGEHPFASQIFGDALLYVDGSLPTQQVYDRILEHLKWTRSNPDAALEKARRAQEVFKTRFTLDRCLAAIYEQLPDRKRQLERLILPAQEHARVDLLLMMPEYSPAALGNLLESAQLQNYPNLKATLLVDGDEWRLHQAAITKQTVCVAQPISILQVPFFNRGANSSHADRLPLGQALSSSIASLPEDGWFMVIAPNERCFSNHVSMLAGALERSAEVQFAHGPEILRQVRDSRTSYNFAPPGNNPASGGFGSFLFRRNAITPQHLSAMTSMDLCAVSALADSLRGALGQRTTIVRGVGEAFVTSELAPGRNELPAQGAPVTPQATAKANVTEVPVAGAAPKVTAVVSAYKCERFLRGCLEDLEAQTIASQLEIIVVDSASPQNEQAIVEEFKKRYSNIVYVRTENRETVYGAWNRAIRMARGQYITNANADDRHRRDALEILARTLDERPDITLVYADCHITRTENETFDNAHPVGRYQWLDFNKHDLLNKGCFVGPQPMWRREVHDEHGYFDASMVSAGDYEFWLRIASNRTFLHIREMLGLYLQSPSSVEHSNQDKAAIEVNEARRRHTNAILGGTQTPAPAPDSPIKPQTTLTLPPCALVGHLAPARELLRQKKHRLAWEAALEAVGKRPFHPEAYVLLGEIAQAAGDVTLGRECGQRAKAMAPEWRPARKFLKQLPGKGRITRSDWKPLPPTDSTPRLSVCMIVKNEERFLAQCLNSVRDLAAEIVVVDTGSTDRTVEIAREFGAKISSFQWCDDFSAARNAALEHATGDWVLMLDADEELPPDTHPHIREALKRPDTMAYRLPLVDHGREDEGASYVPRLFRNAPALFYIGRVHEQVFTSIEVRRKEWGLENRLGTGAILHHGYSKEIMASRNKIDRNLRLLENAVLESPDDPNLMMNLGLELVRSERLVEGLQRYWQAIAIMAAQPKELIVPELREMLFTQLSAYLLQAQDFDGIAKLFAHPLAQSFPLTATMHFNLGMALMKQQQFDSAIRQFEQSIARRNQPSLCPINKEVQKAGPRHCLAVCLKMRHRTAEADEAFKLALDEDPENVAVRCDYSEFLFERNQPVEALQLLHEVITLRPQDTRAWLLGGRIALSRPEFLEVARDWTNTAVQQHPAEPRLARQRAEALMLSQETPAALQAWAKAGEIGDARSTAARFICELLAGAPSAISAESEIAVSNELVKWYRTLLNFGAGQVLEQLNGKLALLKQFLPTAGQLLERALLEASREVNA